MKLPDPKPGMAIPFGYVWADHAEKGDMTPRKEDRPCLIYKLKPLEDGQMEVHVLPISHMPQKKGDGFKLSSEGSAALRLDDEQSWLVTRESNNFLWPKNDTNELRPIAEGARAGEFVLGTLPKEGDDRATAAMQLRAHSGKHRNIHRELVPNERLSSSESRREYLKEFEKDAIVGMTFNEGKPGNENDGNGR